MKRVYCFLLIGFVLAGCVSSKEYKARLSDIEGLKVNLAQTEEKLAAEEELRLKREYEIQEHQKQIAQLKQEIEKQENALKTKQSEAEALLAKIKALEADNQNLSSLLEAKKDQLSKEIFSLRARLSDTEAQLAAAKTEADKLRQQLQEKEKELSALNAKAQALESEKERAIAEMKKTQESLVQELTQEIQKGEIAITQLKDKLTLSMVEKILFDSGSAEIKKDGKKVLERVGAILKNVQDKQIRVEGHTDNVPISARLQAKFPTNWELSTARATNVVRYLQESAGIDPRKLIAAGYSEWRPIAPNDTEENKAKNRRIEIVLVPLEIEAASEAQ